MTAYVKSQGTLCDDLDEIILGGDVHAHRKLLTVILYRFLNGVLDLFKLVLCLDGLPLKSLGKSHLLLKQGLRIKKGKIQLRAIDLLSYYFLYPIAWSLGRRTCC